MAKFLINNIRYSITDEDIDDYKYIHNLPEDYDADIITKEILSSMPKEIIIADLDLNDFFSQEDLEDSLCNIISYQTGWLIEHYNYKQIE